MTMVIIKTINNDLTVHSDRCLISKGLLVLDSIRKYNKTLRYDVGDEFLDELKHTNSGEMPPNSIFVLYAYSRGNLLKRLCRIILNPRDRERKRDLKPRDSRDRTKNLQDSPGPKIPRDKKFRHFGTIISVSPGKVPLSQDSMWRTSRPLTIPDDMGSKNVKLVIKSSLFWTNLKRSAADGVRVAAKKFRSEFKFWSHFWNLIPILFSSCTTLIKIKFK